MRKSRNRHYKPSHLSYRQRLRHLTSTRIITAKQSKALYLIDIYYLKNHKLPKPKRRYHFKPGHRFVSTVNQKQLSKAIRAMYLRKNHQYSLSINKICKKFEISKPSLYRGYKNKYKN